MKKFQLISQFEPAGDQPKAIRQLVDGINNHFAHQTLLGVTGSGKTFTIANVIAQAQKPTLIIAHNKTLAAQLTSELRSFFPKNAVEYFVSYYDYYQPEAYIIDTDTYIEKEVAINEEIDRLRHRATSAILKRKDVIVVASVSAIYNLGSPSDYNDEVLCLAQDDKVTRDALIARLVNLHYTRSSILKRGNFSTRGPIVDIVPPAEEKIYRLNIEKDILKEILVLDLLSKKILESMDQLFIFPAKHFMINDRKLNRAIKDINQELGDRLEELRSQNSLIEAERLERRTKHDVTMIREIGYCNGIENYSRHLSGRSAGSAPETLLDYFGENFLTIIDESHVTVPQIRGMFAGDKARKQNLINYGFRLPSALDNRPLTFKEFEVKTSLRIYLSATPGPYEKQVSCQIVEQLIRPTGLVDPKIQIKPVINQVHDSILEIEKEIGLGNRVLVTTLTKKMAEDLSAYLVEKGLKAAFMHSQVDTLDRIRILDRLRNGSIDVLVGVNLLREGLDLPEVSLVLILDADKEGFLRSEVSLVQTIGRAARNVQGRVILYADEITKSIRQAVSETEKRRQLQLAYNRVHKITPATIQKNIKSLLGDEWSVKKLAEVIEPIDVNRLPQLIKIQEEIMGNLARNLKFEEAAAVRDEVASLKKLASKLRQL